MLLHNDGKIIKTIDGFCTAPKQNGDMDCLSEGKYKQFSAAWNRMGKLCTAQSRKKGIIYNCEEKFFVGVMKNTKMYMKSYLFSW